MGERVGTHYQTSSMPVLPEFPNAACRGEDIDVFFAPDTEAGEGITWRAEQARQVCWRCPERKACLEYALANPALVGVWGGTTAKDRQAMRADKAES